MKHLICCAMLGLVVMSTTAAEKSNSVSVTYSSLSLTFVHQPLSGEGKSLPFLRAALSSGGTERFGVYFDDVPPTSAWVEILDGEGNVLQTLSVNDLLGKGVLKHDRVLPNTGRVTPRRVESIYTTRVQQQDIHMVVKAIASGDAGSADQQLVITFGLRAQSRIVAGLRARFPIAGNVYGEEGGFVITPKSGNGALAASVFPKSARVVVEKNRVAIVGKAKTIEPQRDAPLFWIVIKGVASSSPTDAKIQALRVINDNQSLHGQPLLLVVNVADKEKLAYADTTLYTLVCVNVGAGDARNVVLGNPIPSGTKYVEGSATTNGMTFNVQRKENGSVDRLEWTSAQPLGPGEERIVSFKVVLQ